MKFTPGSFQLEVKPKACGKLHVGQSILSSPQFTEFQSNVFRSRSIPTEPSDPSHLTCLLQNWRTFFGCGLPNLASDLLQKVGCYTFAFLARQMNTGFSILDSPAHGKVSVLKSFRDDRFLESKKLRCSQHRKCLQ